MATVAAAQSNAVKYDLRRFNFGFATGLNYSHLRIQYGYLANNNVPGALTNLTIQGSPGFEIGMVNNLRLGPNVDLRFVPIVSLQERHFDYTFNSHHGGDSIWHRTLEAYYLDLPLMIKYKSDIYHNYRVYAAWGLKYSYNFDSNKQVRDNPNLIRIGASDFSMEFAVGVDLYSDFVKLTPEIRYSMGLINIYDPHNSRYGNAIQQITTQNIMLIFYFE